MGRRGNSSGSAASNPAKRLKAEARPEPNANIVEWSDLHYDVVRDIFRHLPTTKQARCRRVCTGWNSLLVEQLSSSSVISLQYDDLKKWKTIFCPPARETRAATKKREVRLVTEDTRVLIVDFGNIDLRLQLRSQRRVFGLRHGGDKPASMVMKNHPQINRIVVYRARVVSSHYEYMGENSFLSFVEPYLDNGASVVVLGCAVKQDEFSTQTWATTEEYIAIKTWNLSWPYIKLVPAKGYHYQKTLLEYYPTYWSYPPDQLEWLDACLGKLSTEDRLIEFLGRIPVYSDGFLDQRYVVTLQGKPRLKSTAAFCARYLTTFRQDLDLPPPPHPLVWKD